MFRCVFLFLLNVCTAVVLKLLFNLFGFAWVALYCLPEDNGQFMVKVKRILNDELKFKTVKKYNKIYKNKRKYTPMCIMEPV